MRWCSAVVVEPARPGGTPRLLATAQAIYAATDISARWSDGEWISVQVAHVDVDTNLALLGVEDAAFFEGREPVEIAAHAQTKGTVHSIRWRDSRKLEHAEHTCLGVEVRANHADLFRLCCLIAPTRRAWSQPIFAGDQHPSPGSLVGLVTWSGKKQSGAVLPEVIAHYLSLVDAPESYPGSCGIEVRWQVNRHAAQSRCLGAAIGQGVIVTSIPRGSVFDGVLQPRDVLLAIDGVAIHGEGMTDHPHYDSLRFDGLLQTRRPGELARVTLIRAGQRLTLDVKLRAWTSRDRRIPWLRPNPAPRFAVRGGLVFRELDGNYLKSFPGDDWREDGPGALVARAEVEALGLRESHGSAAVIVLGSVLADSYTLGYSGLPAHPVDRVNGRAVEGIPGLIEAFEHPQDGFHVVELAPGNGVRAEIVLDATGYAAAQQRILEAYSIPLAQRV